ncbi:aldehyde dehydrogenase family protein [Rhabdobacter roseus]|uniref:Aldehyde dehydrogenase n=2 Tax=Rhabdobacter roseus TaxID=1655419 RepID=A0A840TTF1_9BACT|nr:aldehyde dehydrogenase (NAD+) [Rhabdobacter roseus]
MNAPMTELAAPAALRVLFEKQRLRAAAQAQTTAEQRVEKLKKLLDYLMVHQEEARQATYADLRKPAAETTLGEIYVLTSEIKYTIKHLPRWMKPQRVPTPLSALGTSGYVQYEAKGNALIMAPWNYPINLALKPLVSAVAAGCVAVVKPSELTPHSSAFVRKVIEAVFAEEEVAVVEGDAAVAQALLELPFNHIFFTGSPAIGKIVMKAAAEHLASVTLELGGKSPAIVDETADLRATARTLAWGKYLNNGQTCIAPDYVLVHNSVKDKLVDELKGAIGAMYDPEGRGMMASENYARIVNQNHFERLQRYLDDALNQGAVVAVGGQSTPADRYLQPTVLTHVTERMKVMQEEIFGPILPVLTYQTPTEAVDYVNARPKPLALYVHSRRAARADYFLKNISAGNALVNEVLTQFGHHELPFGGVNNSGIGKSNGFYGFQEFSNPKGVVKRKFGTLRFLYPPYTERQQRILGWLVKYL